MKFKVKIYDELFIQFYISQFVADEACINFLNIYCIVYTATL